MYIRRDLEDLIVKIFSSARPQGLILAGIAGFGKTTLAEQILKLISPYYEVFTFSGDDAVFRAQIARDTTYLHKIVSSRTTRRSFIFVDEVQKSEMVFDAVKYAFDKSNTSFLVTGSNPAYLDSVARQRLQRRADKLLLAPFSLPEILAAKGLLTGNEHLEFAAFLRGEKSIPVYAGEITVTQPLLQTVADYMQWGGLPLTYLSEDADTKLREIRKVVDRGFEPLLHDTNNLTEIVRVELSYLHSQEFSYHNLFKKTGIRQRDLIKKVIDELISHGYLICKQPLILEQNKRSYLKIYSYSDPGIVKYLSAAPGAGPDTGRNIEAYVHTRLHQMAVNSPSKSEIHYFKPYTIGSDDKLKFAPGEIDFVYTHGKRMLPIECKSKPDRTDLDVKTLREFVRTHKLDVGVVLYGGVPYWDARHRVLYWPFWML